MREDGKNDKTSLAHSSNPGLTKQSAALVQRGLRHLSQGKPRHVKFPDDWSMGTIYEIGSELEIWERSVWRKIGEARGEMRVQPNSKLILQVEPCERNYYVELAGEFEDYKDNYFIDLSPLTSFNPNCLQGLDLSNWLSFCPKEIGYRGNLEIISKLTGLEWLSIFSGTIGSFSFLENLTNLRGLDIESTDICSLAPLQKLINLRYLNLSATEIYDLEYLEDLTNLEILDISETGIWGLFPLYNLPKLRILDLSRTGYNKHAEEIKRLKLALPHCEIWF